MTDSPLPTEEKKSDGLILIQFGFCVVGVVIGLFGGYLFFIDHLPPITMGDENPHVLIYLLFCVGAGGLVGWIIGFSSWKLINRYW